MLDEASVLRIERTVHECLQRHLKQPGSGMELAYRRVFLDVLRRVPAGDMPHDPLLIRFIVQACEFAATAMFMEHGAHVTVIFLGVAPYQVNNWANDCHRFVRLLLDHWDDIAFPVADSDHHLQLVLEHEDWLDDLTDNIPQNIEGSENKGRLRLEARWLRQIEEFFLAVACFWFSEDAARAFRKDLDDNCRILYEYECLRADEGGGNS